MANRITSLGGTSEWGDGDNLTPDDLNDSFNRIVELVNN